MLVLYERTRGNRNKRKVVDHDVLTPIPVTTFSRKFIEIDPDGPSSCRWEFRIIAGLKILEKEYDLFILEKLLLKRSLERPIEWWSDRLFIYGRKQFTLREEDLFFKALNSLKHPEELCGEHEDKYLTIKNVRSFQDWMDEVIECAICKDLRRDEIKHENTNGFRLYNFSFCKLLKGVFAKIKNTM